MKLAMQHIHCCLLITLLSGIWAASPVQAHSLGESYGVLRAASDGQSYTVTYNMRRDQFLQLADLRFYSEQSPQDVVAAVVREHYELYAGAERCETTRFAAIETEAFLQASFVARCSKTEPLELRNDAFFELLPDHLHFVRVSAADGSFVAERVMDRVNRSWVLPEAPSTAVKDIALRYLGLGIDHMAFGFDHLAFLGSVLLLVRGMKALLLAITGFTLGHSITLALAVLGLAVPNGQLVEALIGLTIALVAAESLFRQQQRVTAYARVIFVLGVIFVLMGIARIGPEPITMAGVWLFFGAYLLLTNRRETWLPWAMPLLTAFFGLIHGFGFAGSLLEIGLPTQQLAIALFTFNLGIEIGQLLIVGALLVLLGTMQRLAPAIGEVRGPAVTLAACALVTLGTFWFVDRGFA